MLLEKKQIRAQLLSSDALRMVLTPKPSYSLEERDIVYAALVYVAQLLTRNGVNVIIDATGNLRRYRDHARATIERFMEIYLICPLEVCILREKNRKETFHAPRQIYSKARRGKAPTVPGIGQPYEAPLNAELIIDTSIMKTGQVADNIMKALKKKFIC